MIGKFLTTRANQILAEPNIYADKSSLVLEWLLLNAVENDQFSIREMANNTGVSLGLVQKVFGILTMHGYLHITGLRTAKKIILKKLQLLLKAWLEHSTYDRTKNCFNPISLLL